LVHKVHLGFREGIVQAVLGWCVEVELQKLVVDILVREEAARVRDPHRMAYMMMSL
jgi:hypothetical protein